MQSIRNIIIIGAGPVGLACAIQAAQKGLSCLVLEKGVLVNSIYKGPTHGTFFSTARQLEIGNVPFVSQFPKPTRQEICHYYRRVAEHHDLNIRFHTPVNALEDMGASFRIGLDDQDLYSKSVIVATGFYDQPNMLGIKGENLPHVSHYYKEAHMYFGQNVVVVGGRNSAIEAALEIFRAGGHVSLVHKDASFSNKVKYWLLPDIENRIKEGSIRAYFETRVVRISEKTVTLKTGTRLFEIENDAVLAMTGYHPNQDLLQQAGVNIDPETLVPEHDPDSLETNVKGLYVAGSPVAGRDCNKIFIENGRLHAKPIIDSIVTNLGE
ncbi:YpdA family putative bacillithiol disulfide reductase [candidate division KSB1 bacterium]|nr:YpdA family putative bacillithiol disulfide reductase [candidate division KSB1 bacterium]